MEGNFSYPRHEGKEGGGEPPGTHQIGETVSPSTGLDVAGEEKNFLPLPGFNSAPFSS